MEEQHKDEQREYEKRELLKKSINAQLRQKLSKQERLVLQLKLRALDNKGPDVTPEIEALVNRYFIVRFRLGMGIKGDERKKMLKEYYDIQTKLGL